MYVGLWIHCSVLLNCETMVGELLCIPSGPRSEIPLGRVGGFQKKFVSALLCCDRCLENCEILNTFASCISNFTFILLSPSIPELQCILIPTHSNTLTAPFTFSILDSLYQLELSCTAIVRNFPATVVVRNFPPDLVCGH